MIGILFSAISFIAILFHEPWRNEAQAWLIARDLSLSGIIGQMKYEGSPALWHMLLLPFAKTGLPYFSMNILHWLISVSIVFLFLKYSPFNIFIKILFVFSYLMIYEYTVIARNYNISILLLFGICTMYASRFKKSIIYAIFIFLLINSNIHSIGASLALMLLFFYESLKGKIIFKRKIILSTIIMLAGIVFAYIQLNQSYKAGQEMFNISFSGNYLLRIKYCIVALNNAFNLNGFPESHLWLMIISAISVLIFSFFFLSIIRNKKVLFFLSLSSISLFGIFAFIQSGHIRHHGFFILFFLITLWLLNYYSNQSDFSDKIKPKIKFLNFQKIAYFVLIIVLSTSLLNGFRAFVSDIKRNFSGARETADFIKKNNLNNRQTIFIAYPSPETSAILPYLDKISFWYPDVQEFGTYITWNKNFRKNNPLTSDEILKRVNSKFKTITNIYLILGESANFKIENNLNLIFKNSMLSVVDEETFRVYKLR